MYPHVQGRMCKHPADRTQEAEDSNLCKQRKHDKKLRSKIYVNKGSMATARKQNLHTNMGRASAGRCRACTHDGHARAWRTHAMNMCAHAKCFVDVDCVDVNSAGKLGA